MFVMTVVRGPADSLVLAALV